MIPMSCPSCGRKGNVPLDRLNTRMHCKKCDAVFHLDASGKPVIGEPPAAKGSKAARRAKDEPLDPIGIVASKLANIPKPIWLGLAGALGIYLLWVASAWFRPRDTSPEENFSERNVQAAKAFLERDMSTLDYLTTEDSREEMAKLVETFRPLVGDKAGKGSEDMMPVAVIPDPLQNEPSVEISIQPPKAPDADEAPPMFAMDLVWIKGKKQYYINGKATLAANLEREKIRKEREANK